MVSAICFSVNSFLTLIFILAGTLTITAESCIDGVGEVLGTVILGLGVDVHPQYI